MEKCEYCDLTVDEINAEVDRINEIFDDLSRKEVEKWNKEDTFLGIFGKKRDVEEYIKKNKSIYIFKEHEEIDLGGFLDLSTDPNGDKKSKLYRQDRQTRLLEMDGNPTCSFCIAKVEYERKSKEQRKSSMIAEEKAIAIAEKAAAIEKKLDDWFLTIDLRESSTLELCEYLIAKRLTEISNTLDYRYRR